MVQIHITLLRYIELVLRDDLTAAENDTKDIYFEFTIGLFVPIAILSLYFLYIEIQQMRGNFLYHFDNFWAWIDFWPQILNLVIIVLFFLIEKNQELFDSLLMVASICSFLMWAKFLSFLRFFSSFSYLIRMIILVMSDMKYFLAVMIISLIAFGDAFFVISLGSTDEFIPSF